MTTDRPLEGGWFMACVSCRLLQTPALTCRLTNQAKYRLDIAYFRDVEDGILRHMALSMAWPRESAFQLGDNLKMSVVVMPRERPTSRAICSLKRGNLNVKSKYTARFRQLCCR